MARPRSRPARPRRSPWLRALLLFVLPSCAVVLVLAALSRGCDSSTPMRPGFAKLTAPDGTAQSWFGEAVSLHGDTLVAGAPLDGGAAPQAGAAYVFVRDRGGWALQTKLLPIGGAPRSKFGGAVAVQGDTVLVGAGQGDAWAGSTHVFLREGTRWTERQKLTAPPGIRSVRFGRSLAIDGNTCLVGGVVRKASWDTEGVVYVFVRRDPEALWEPQTVLKAPGGAGHLDFGHAVALSGDCALIGAPTDIEETGKVWSFVRRGTAWGVEQELVASGRKTDDFYGRAVALAGDTAIIGAAGARTRGPSSGTAFVFERVGTDWVELQTLLPEDLADLDVFGYSLALHDDLAVVGATGRSPYAAYVFERVDGIFVEREKIVPDDAAPAFGHTVSAWGDTVAIGAYGDDDRGPASGSVLVRKLPASPAPATSGP